MAAVIGVDAISCPSGFSIPNIVGWTVNRDVTVIETTACTDTERKRKSGLKDSNGTITAICDDTTAIVAVPSEANLTLTIASGRSIQMKVILHSFTVNWLIDGRTEVTYNWSQTGTATVFTIA